MVQNGKTLSFNLLFFNPNLMFSWLEDMTDEMVMLRAKIIILCHCLINVYENIMVNIFNILTFKMSEHQPFECNAFFLRFYLEKWLQFLKGLGHRHSLIPSFQIICLNRILVCSQSFCFHPVPWSFPWLFSNNLNSETRRSLLFKTSNIHLLTTI